MMKISHALFQPEMDNIQVWYEDGSVEVVEADAHHLIALKEVLRNVPAPAQFRRAVVLDTLLEELNPGQAKRKALGICAICHEPVGVFTSEISRMEYCITGWCQACQDDFYGHEEF